MDSREFVQFTPDRLNELDVAAALAEINPGYSRVELDRLLAEHKKAWLEANRRMP